MRKVQRERKGHSFVIATFTATAIYHGLEDMYDETINSLHLFDPITYMRLQNDNNFTGVAIYHGRLGKDDKRENYEKFYCGDKPVMLATKAFGMGIDINDIEIVMHFAPTGNVCDYVQELGKAAQKIFNRIVDETQGGQLYITNTAGNVAKEFNTVLGILEALSVLSFKMTGGTNSQLYIHINQIRNLKSMIDDGERYTNKILNSVSLRHKISVEMLTYIYEGDFDNEKIWDLPEDYFLGKIPDEVRQAVH